MSRHLRTLRLTSGILFSPPADYINARADVRRPKEKSRALKVNTDLILYDAKVEHRSSALMIQDEHFSQNIGNNYSVFPQFLEASATTSLNDGFPSNEESESISSISSKSPATLCLPILSISMDVSIDGMISLTKLTQSFYNPSDLVIPQARHTFPLYDGAVVTSFECRVGDSRRLQGVVKPTGQARHEFEKSSAKKREAAALLEELAPEIFETSLGNIPAKTTVEISLTYVHELRVVISKGEKAEGLAIVIPTSIAPRYAAPVFSAPLPELPSEKLNITIGVLDSGTINPADCHVESKHPATYEGYQPISNVLISNIAELRNLNSTASGAEKMQHVWHYSSGSQPALKSDFVLVIQMRAGTRLHSRAVIAPTNEIGHAALMVSLRPNDIFGSAVLPQLFKGEILFVLDQSKSMSWTQSGTKRLKIETMRNAMSLALSVLPSTCSFNIISFGSEVRGMWLRSRSANEPENLSYAREYLTNVKANMRGTQVLLALKGAVNNYEPTHPSTQIILITDGEVPHESHDSILQYVWETRQKLGEKIRFFTLGIGDDVSHSIVESIAELGGGYCDVIDVVKKSCWEDRLNVMLRSVMEPDRWTFDIDLGPGYQRRSLAAYNFGADDRPDENLAIYAQGPHPIPSLHPYRYKSFFFLLDLRNAKLPKTVTIKTTTDAAKKKVYTIIVEPAQLGEDTIHPLAAKMILCSLEDEVKRAGVSKEQARINAEILGTRYAISSKWTSFVAVADESGEQTCQMDIYKSVFREVGIQEFLGSENAEISEDDEELCLLIGDENKLSCRTTPPCAPSSKFPPGVHCVYNLEPNVEDPFLFMGDKFSRREDAGSTIYSCERPYLRKAPAVEESDLEESNPETLISDCIITGEAPEVPALEASDLEEFDLEAPAVAHLDPEKPVVETAGCPPRLMESAFAPGTDVATSVDLGAPAVAKLDPEAPAVKNPIVDPPRFISHESCDRPITWQDAAECERRGMFILPLVVRQRLGLHFCTEAAKRLREILRNSSGAAQVTEEEATAIIDTLMMIQYFKTHLATQQDYWDLLIGKAERALLLALGYDERQEEALEPMCEQLLSAIFHVHFVESLKHASVCQADTGKSPDSSRVKTCLICNTSIETDRERPLAANKEFICLADECYDNETQSRKRYTNWTEFWEHQVQSGHILCPKVDSKKVKTTKRSNEKVEDTEKSNKRAKFTF